MRRDELGIIRFRYVRESEFNAIPEQDRDLYTRYIVFKDDSDEILYEYLYGQKIEAVGFATTEYVDNEITNAIMGSFEIDLSDYATKTYVDSEIANIDIGNIDIDLSEYATKTYVDSEIANVDIDLSGYATNEDIKEVISGVSYNTLDHKITFNRYNDVDIVIDLPIEALLVGLSLDGDDLVLELEDGSTQRVPLNTLLVGVVKKVNGQTPNSNGEVNLNYTDLNNLPNLFSGNYEDLINKPELFSKDYNDLINKPDFQDKLTAGDNITIDPITNVISASGGSEYQLTRSKVETVLRGTGGGSFDYSLQLGWSAAATGSFSTALGEGARAQQAGSIALGRNAYAAGVNSIAIGRDTYVAESNVVDFGSSRQVRVNLIPVNDRDAVSKSYFEDTISSIGGGSGGGPVDWADIENKPSIPSNTSDLINDSDYTTKTYVDNAIANIDIGNVDLSDYVTNEAIKEVISGVSYNTLDHKITFNRYNDVDIVVDLPIESLLVGLSLNGDDLVLELEDGTTTSVPLNTLLVGVVKNVNGKVPNSSGVVSLDYSDLNNLPNLFSGDYEDLTNKPIIPDVSDFATTTYVDDKDTIKEQNNNTNIKFWTGSQAEYNSLGGWYMNVIYFITEE